MLVKSSLCCIFSRSIMCVQCLIFIDTVTTNGSKPYDIATSNAQKQLMQHNNDACSIKGSISFLLFLLSKHNHILGSDFVKLLDQQQ